MHGELKALVPHGVEGVAVDWFGAEVAAVDGNAQDVHLDAGAASAVTRTNVLTGDDLSRKEEKVVFCSYLSVITKLYDRPTNSM